VPRNELKVLRHCVLYEVCSCVTFYTFATSGVTQVTVMRLMYYAWHLREERSSERERGGEHSPYIIQKSCYDSCWYVSILWCISTLWFGTRLRLVHQLYFKIRILFWRQQVMLVAVEKTMYSPINSLANDFSQ
jgi:hypothetical protein